MWNGFSQWTISKKYKKSEDPNCSLRLTPEKHRGTRSPLAPWPLGPLAPWHQGAKGPRGHRLRKTGTGCPRGPPPPFSSETIRLIFFCWSFNYFWGPLPPPYRLSRTPGGREGRGVKRTTQRSQSGTAKIKR